MQRFYLGLNMSGTVSAGAYTAGVIDFFVEAMDEWYAERERQKQQFGTNYEQWTIPPHELELDVMTGASGGGINAALTAAALNQDFAHVTNQQAAKNVASNVLFQSWVEKIDISGLLTHRDLDGGKLVSLLDSSTIQDIARDAFKSPKPLSARRDWVREGLKIILTLTNLRGVPYAVEPGNDVDTARTLYYADKQEFAVHWQPPQKPESTLNLNPSGTGAWSQLADAAIATSAFPVVLAPQTLKRTSTEYMERLWRIPKGSADCGGTAGSECESVEAMQPDWDIGRDVAVETLNVDGGTTNNSPVDCARLELAGLDPQRPTGHNERDPLKADRAVISIAPLASAVPKKLPDAVQANLLSLPGNVVDVLINQSRIQGENLKLTSDPGVASRWLIGPTSELTGTEPLAGSLLCAFGAFVAQPFREHDYQLGRRNCQRFLTTYFGLPWENAIFKQYGLGVDAQTRLSGIYGMPTSGPAKSDLCPLIPVVPKLRTEITVTREPIPSSALSPIADMAVDRVKRVGDALLKQSGGGFGSGVGLNLVWLVVKGKLRDGLLKYAGKALASEGYVK